MDYALKGIVFACQLPMLAILGILRIKPVKLIVKFNRIGSRIVERTYLIAQIIPRYATTNSPAEFSL